MWLAENEGAKFWLNVLTELKNRGLNDILIACVDGLKGFPDAIMHRAYGAQQPALRVMEGLQSRHSRPESDLSGSHGRGRPAGTGSVRSGLGQSLSGVLRGCSR